MEYLVRIYNPNYHIFILSPNKRSDSLGHKVKVVNFITIGVKFLFIGRDPWLKHRGDPSDKVAVTQFGEEGELGELGLVNDHHELHFESGWQVFHNIIEIVISFICIDIQGKSYILEKLIFYRVLHSQLVQLIDSLLEQSFFGVVG